MNFNSIFGRLRRIVACALMIVFLIAVVLSMVWSPEVNAQSGFNTFEEQRALILQAPTILTVADAPRTTIPIDISDFDGIGTIFITIATNTPGAVLTLAIEDSVLGTNAFSAISNAAYGTSTTMVGSNTYLTNLKSTNTYIIPGTITTPTAATAGFATPYILGAPFTNTVSALAVSNVGVYAIGVNVPAMRRYIHLVYTTSGAATNVTTSAILVARPKQQRNF